MFSALEFALDRERQARIALRVSEGRLAEVERLARIGSWELDLTRGVLWWSDEIYRIFEVAPDRFAASYEAFLDMVHPEDRDAVHRAHSESVARRIPYEIVHRLLMPDGRVKYLEELGRTIYDDAGVPVQSVGTVQDVTERVRVEAQALVQERLRQAVRVSNIGIFDHDHLANTVYWSPRQREIHGWNANEPVSLSDFEGLVHADDATGIVAAVRRAHDPAGDGAWDVDYRIIRRDGSVRWLIARSQTFFEGEGAARRPARTVGAVIDDTERRLVVEAMRIKDQAIATSLNGIAISDADGKIVYANPAFMRLWKCTSDAEVLGKMPFDFAENRQVILQFLANVRAHGADQGEFLARRSDGTTFDVLVSANVVSDASGRIVNMMGSFLDVSDAKRLQAQLLHAQKMESVGRLAGGVAHDFNNLLTVIKGYLGLALTALDPRDPLHGDLTEVSKAADSAASLTNQLLAFSRKQIIKPQPLDLNDVILRLEKMLLRLLGEDIELLTALAPDLGLVRFDKGQCEQILVNLAVNARDALPDGGRLTLGTANVTIAASGVGGDPGFPPGDYVTLAVSDTGTGMSEEVKAHLFEPFFTTKESGRGTGLGLAMVYGAVSQNGGRIEVNSEVGHGTSFTIYLPRVRDAQVQVTAESLDDPERGSETIVLVEDDQDVRTLASVVLTRHGYTVHAFDDGRSMIDAVRGMAEPVHLLITDVVMPEMNGRAAAEQLTAIRPAIKVLFTSGYTDDVVVRLGVLTEGVEFLQKPYSVDSLARRVRTLLDARGA